MTTLLNGAMKRMTGKIKEDLKLARRVVTVSYTHLTLPTIYSV